MNRSICSAFSLLALTCVTVIAGCGGSSSPPPPPSIMKTPAPSSGVLDMPYDFSFTATGGAPPLTWSETGALPSGLMINSGGLLSGTPTAAGSFPITVMVQDSLGRNAAPQNFTIMVFTGCVRNGAICRPGFAPCCPGLVCVPGTLRDFCQPDFGAAEEASRFTATCFMESTRELHTATLLSNGIVLITGGDNGTVSLATAELFNPASSSFAPTGDMVDARARHAATLLTNGAVLVIGGRDASGNVLATAELFAPSSISFAPTGSMSTARESHTATQLNDGKVLITGGDNGKVSLATAELFDPTSESFTPTGNMGTPRGFQTATLLKNGKVLVIGGRDASGNALATAELFDPTTGSFMPTGSMRAAREFHTATLRNDGAVLVAGGANFTSVVAGGTRTEFLPESTATAELFNPASGSFTPMGQMAYARARHTATLLTDGTILLTGGVDEQILEAHIPITRILTTAELFQ